jgi:membrane-bound lytic murein transglycosylase D
LALFVGAWATYQITNKDKPRGRVVAEDATPSRAGAVSLAAKDIHHASSGFVWDEIVNISRRFGDAPPSSMDKRFVTEVESWIARFTRHNRHKILLQRKDKYWATIESALREYNLPIELGYVVWAESEFEPTAVSSAGAVGLWQFIPDTGREYGLRVTDTIDERLNPTKSSQAAARYFTMLLRMFGSDRYLLALASYNTGQYRVQRQELANTLRHERQTDFWHIKDQLPQETADYVPKILAAMIIGRNPDRW